MATVFEVVKKIALIRKTKVRRPSNLVQIGLEIADEYRRRYNVIIIPTKEITESFIVNDYPEEFIPVIEEILKKYIPIPAETRAIIQAKQTLAPRPKRNRIPLKKPSNGR